MLISQPYRGRRLAPFARIVLAVALAGCGGAGGSTAVRATGGPSSPSLSAAALLGQKIFSDKALSASGQQSCATCHVAQFAFAADPTATGPDADRRCPWVARTWTCRGFAIRPR